MRVLIPTLLAPLLVSALPASIFNIQGETNGVPHSLGNGGKAVHNALDDVPVFELEASGFDLDLGELRLVQFSEDEPPV
jgi:leucyl aminopeptidase